MYEHKAMISNSISKNKDYFFTTTAKDMKNELEEVYRKAKAWEELKEEMRSMFIWGSDLPKGTPSKHMNEAYGIVFKTMCELDNTNEFSNLLSDLEDNQND